tara:strand:+ start:120 stop:554 length:435 start_codon:yes stop_codon:yes gene_type:complete
MPVFDLFGLNILLLDDSRAIRTVLTTLLRGLGVNRIYQSRDADEALVTARLCRPDLLLVDYDLGVTSGLEAISRFRDTAVSPHPDLPIILLAPPNLSYLARGAEAAGADAILPKPVNAGTLGARIHAVLQGGACAPAARLSHQA